MSDLPDLAALEAQVGTALRSGDDSALRVLGYGEISLVVGWPAQRPAWACKRLPPFASAAAADAYASLLERSLELLAERGVDVVPTEFHVVDGSAGGLAGYCVQPVVEPGTLAPEVLRSRPDEATAVLEAIAAVVDRVVDERVGLDAQLSNWAWVEGGLRYLDVTTPLLRDDRGRSLLDVDLFLAALPAVLRPGVRRFVLPGIIARYHDTRTVLVDLCANLVKEGLERCIDDAVAVVNRHVDPPLTAEAVRGDYASDARTWRLLLAARRADRWWQRHVRRRTYPFLLPGPIER